MRVDGAAGPLALGAKGSACDRLRLTGGLRASALGSYIVLWRSYAGCAQWHYNPCRRLAVRIAMGCQIGALPCTPFASSRRSPQGETRSMERKNRESYISRTISAFSPFGGWRHHLARWEACHWIRGSRGSPMNPVPLPPPQFGGAAKGKRLNGQARRLTSPHLEVLCRTSTGDYKAPLCRELLMKGLLFRALFCPRLRGKSGAAG